MVRVVIALFTNAETGKPRFVPWQSRWCWAAVVGIPGTDWAEIHALTAHMSAKGRASYVSVKDDALINTSTRSSMQRRDTASQGPFVNPLLAMLTSLQAYTLQAANVSGAKPDAETALTASIWVARCNE